MGEITWGTATAVLVAPFVFLLPGWALLSLLLPAETFGQGRHTELVVEAMLAASLTLALTPLALLYLDLLGVRVGGLAVLIYLAASAAVLFWRRGRAWYAALRQRLPRPDGPQVALALTILAILGVRLWVVRGINVGFWGDSYQHTLMTQLILDNGGLFSSWEPYAPLTSFSYHFGFHSNVALFQAASGWLTGNPTPRTVVLMGQFLNVLAVVMLYPLTVRLSGGSRWTGVVVVTIAGLLTPMPMHYVNWGRYTQLCGQAILLAAAWFFLEAVEAPRRDVRRLLPALLAAAGLALTHYFVLAFYVLLVAVLAGWRLWPQRSRPQQSRPAQWKETILRTAAIGAVALVLVVPWAGRILEGLLPQTLTGFVQGRAAAEHIATENLFYPLADFVPLYLVAMAVVGGLWALARRRATGLLLIWTGTQFLVSNPHWLGLPGTGVITNFTVELSLYIPVSILAADFVVSLIDVSQHRFVRLHPAPAMAAGLLVAAAAGLGVGDHAHILDDTYQLVTPADEAALAWVRENTPQEARFLANAFFAYGDSLIVGSDAGWWLPLLAGRQNTVPPLNYGAEAGPDPGYMMRVNEMTRHLYDVDLGDPATVRYLEDEGITHVFIGEKGGPLLDATKLQESPYYRIVYAAPANRPGPWVFEVVHP
ncbi:MAG: hypothetical protein JXA93_25015 [Anaerolineae bacterium]|nr:hypothetical protein [Anaerolineae bacterium]